MAGLVIYRQDKAWAAVIPAEFRADPAFEFCPRSDLLPNVLLIGDSISMGYTPIVRERLRGRAAVLRIPDSARSTAYTLSQLDEWLRSETWDVIHANWGLHDLLCRTSSGGRFAARFVEPDDYRRNLSVILDCLLPRTRRLVLATTTPVPPGARLRMADDERTYNAIMREVAAARSIQLSALWEAIVDSPHSLQVPSNVHFTADGNAELGRVVAGVLADQLTSLPGTAERSPTGRRQRPRRKVRFHTSGGADQ